MRTTKFLNTIISVFRWYRHSEEGRDTKFQYPHRGYKLNKGCRGSFYEILQPTFVMFKFMFSTMTISNCIPFGLLQRKILFPKRYITFESSETFRITNVQIQFIPFYHSRSE